ncbi:MAG: hypothetical protein AB7P04_04850 [Bacteriovoracia bacterium]
MNYIPFKYIQAVFLISLHVAFSGSTQSAFDPPMVSTKKAGAARPFAAPAPKKTVVMGTRG